MKYTDKNLLLNNIITYISDELAHFDSKVEIADKLDKEIVNQ